ncbi:N4-gp56 family major capsid protein [Martelella sp. AD-3]|uniref:N4-gp56 family major capsid protein n=1 Tax=Martelella sp. AD-3 TaxID=686597 RepID=UPI0004B7AFFB|nr:N4-gp56 family major capsid protein [Martelella sp. AD-3]AMM84117.1 N4-gp56 family major capsid protein [Martelella sp. AD-3]
MGQTTIPFGDPKAQMKWSGRLLVETLAKSYWERFISTSENAVIQRKTELESDAGDRISFDLSVQLRGGPTSGDNRLKGTEEQLKFFTDEVIIDQLRKSVSAGGKMTRKRTAHDLRRVAKDRLSDWWSQYVDQLFFIYMSGARGINEDYEAFPLDYDGHAGNELRAPDGQHILFGGDAASKATITADDKMSRLMIERAANKARMMRAKDPRNANLLPIKISGEKHYVTVMSPYQEHDLRTESGQTGWLEIQKAAAASEGRKSPIFRGSMGMINNVVLHSHESVIRFSDYGAGQDVSASRALFLGTQAAVVAHGTAGGLRFTWKEEVDDYGNEPSVAAGTIIGVSKTRFNKRDFGVVAIDTAASDPNEA